MLGSENHTWRLEPHPFKTKTGRDITIRLFLEEEPQRLFLFYDEFEPKEGYQGLPPRSRSTRRQWVDNLIRGNLTLLAVEGDRVIGHATAISIPSSSMAELIVFVHQDFQNQGIGTELIRLTAEYAANMGFRRLWLTVLSANLIAVYVLRKCGFRFISPMDSEREMVMDIASLQSS